MKFTINNINYIIVSRSEIHPECQPCLTPDQSVADWLKVYFPHHKIIPGFKWDSLFFNKYNTHFRDRLNANHIQNTDLMFR